MVRGGLIFFLVMHSALISGAQGRYEFQQGLVAGPLHQYGRDAVVIDRFAYEFYKNVSKSSSGIQSWMKQVENDSIRWEEITVDTAGVFRSDKLANGYLYLTYHSDSERVALLNVSGNSMVFFNGEPRAGDIYRSGWLALPVSLKKGANELLIRCSSWARWQGISASLTFPEKKIALTTEDLTLPHIVLQEDKSVMTASIVVTNGTATTLSDLTITTECEGRSLSTKLSAITPHAIRKVPFRINAENVTKKGNYNCIVELKRKGIVLDRKSISLEGVNNDEHHSNTFTSEMDGSIQYYAVTPQSKKSAAPPALFLSVHGAGVEAIGQARAYQRKEWGVLVAPTNRRPRGFNWEDWGMLDALEVLKIAKEKFKPDPQRIYLTGHSMGGHGTWYLGAMFPDRWAAIAPCAGYPSLMGYGSSDGKIPEGKSSIEKMLRRSSNASDIFELASNYKPLGVYIHHGDSDKVVSVNYARQMRKLLGEFHPDFNYYEYPGGSHWFGDESVDWPPIFDYFKWHSIPFDSAVDHVDFTTVNPALSSRYHWADILQQDQSMVYSRIRLHRDRKNHRISGSTENISLLGFDLKEFGAGRTITIALDNMPSMSITTKTEDDYLYLEKKNHWKISSKPDPADKGTLRGGTFKAAFNQRMVFVYSTKGSKSENAWSYNKARYDAEVWYYRGNGGIDIIRDTDFNLTKYKDRGVILYGNASTNHAWRKLLDDCPIQVKRGSIAIGEKRYDGEDLAAYFVWKRKDSDVASVGVVTGSGLPGMRATEANQYFAAGSGFPDFMIFTLDMLKYGAKGLKAAGFYNNEWALEKDETTLEE